jgi:hypothetical protein
MQAMCSSETSVSVGTTSLYSPENSDLYSLCCLGLFYRSLLNIPDRIIFYFLNVGVKICIFPYFYTLFFFRNLRGQIPGLFPSPPYWRECMYTDYNRALVAMHHPSSLDAAAATAKPLRAVFLPTHSHEQPRVCIRQHGQWLWLEIDENIPRMQTAPPYLVQHFKIIFYLVVILILPKIQTILLGMN